MQSNQKSKILVAFQTIIFGFILIALINRALKSVEMTDEIHGIASILNILSGKKPFSTSWDYHTGWCLVAPFYSIFLAVRHGSREGIVFFSRILYLAVVLLILFITARLVLRSSNPHRKVPWLLSLLGTITYVPFSIFQLSYNTVTIYLFLLLLAILQFLHNERKNSVLYVIPGIIMGLICISYPVMTIVGVLLCLGIFLLYRKNAATEKILAYGTGLLVIGVVYLSWILIGSNVDSVVRGAIGMITSPHQLSRGPLYTFLEGAILKSGWRYIKNNVFMFAYIILQIMAYLYYRKSNYQRGRFSYILLFTAFSVYIRWILYSNNSNYSDALVYFSVSSYIFVFLWTLMDPQLNFKRYILYLGGILTFSLIYTLSTDDQNILLAFWVSNMITAFVSILALRNWIEKVFDFEHHKYIICLAPVVSLLFFSLPGLISANHLVYRDAPVQELVNKVESGIFKGLYTTEKRVNLVQNFEIEVVNHIDPDRTLCVVTREPMIYVMSKAEVYSPQTWDPQFLYRGFTSAQPFLSYFEAMGGELPDVIAATNSSVEDFYENNRYEIVSFIQKYYDLYYTNTVDGITLWLWQRK